MLYIDTNLGRIITFGDIIKFVERLKELHIEQDTPVYILINDKYFNIVDMGANKDLIVFSDKKLE